MLPTEVFGNLFRREFGFADVAEVSGKVNGFSCKKKKKKEKTEKKKKERRQDIKRLAMGLRNHTGRMEIYTNFFCRSFTT